MPSKIHFDQLINQLIAIQTRHFGGTPDRCTYALTERLCDDEINQNWLTIIFSDVTVLVMYNKATFESILLNKL